MSIDKIINFLKNDIRGLIILGILSSIVAALLYDIVKRQFLKSIRYLERKKKLNRIKRHLKNYTDGFTAGYAEASTYRQIALVGEFVILTIVKVGLGLFTTLVFIFLLILISKPLSWILVIFYAIVITIQYRRLKEYLRSYNLFQETVFGQAYLEKAKKAANEYLDNKIKEQKKSSEGTV